MPDIFVVMSDDELNESLSYAKEQKVKEVLVFENIQYNLFFDEIDAVNYLKDSYWFPHFSHYIMLKTENDVIGLLLSSTIWNDYDITKLYNLLKEYGFSFNLIKDKWFNPNSVSEFNEKNRLASKKSPVNSPWIARDIEVVEDALFNIENINNIKIIKDINVKLIVYTYLHNMTPIPNRSHIVTLDYPNIMHLNTESGEYNIFMGSKINIADVKKMLEKSNISFRENIYNSSIDPGLVLYKSRDKNIWEDSIKGCVKK